MGGLIADQIDHIAVAQMLLPGGRAGQHIDHGGVAVALGNGDSHLRNVCGGAVLINLVLGSRQIAGIGIERVHQAMQRAVGHVGNVGIGDVVVLNLAQNLGVDADLAVGGILLIAGMHAEPSELALNIAQAEAGEDRHGDRKNETLEESGHTHHQRGPHGEAGRSYLIDAMITQLALGKSAREGKADGQAVAAGEALVGEAAGEFPHEADSLASGPEADRWRMEAGILIGRQGDRKAGHDLRW